MDITVNLQEQFSYSLWPIIVVGAMILICIVMWIAIFLKNKSKRKAASKLVEIKTIAPKNPEKIKEKYLVELTSLENDIRYNKISTRDAYQKMSICIRSFVFDMTGIEVQNYTLTDIQNANMPKLAQLVEEYYRPEFAYAADGNGMGSLLKTKRVIERWN